MWRRFIELFDWAARVHFAGTAVWAGAGWAVTFFATSASGWDASLVWLASLFAGACCAIIFMAFKAASSPVAVVPRQLDETVPILEGQQAPKDEPENQIVDSQPAAWPHGFNVPRIWFQIPDLESKGLIHINVDVFNGTGERIFLRSIDGRIQVNQRSPATAPEVPLTKLITPTFFSARQNHFDAYQPFSFILEQELPQQLVEKLLNWDSGVNYVFDFDKLNIWAQSTRDPEKVARLPLWEAAVLVKTASGISASYMARLWGDRPWRIPQSQ
jgi:hypothetical protein